MSKSWTYFLKARVLDRAKMSRGVMESFLDGRLLKCADHSEQRRAGQMQMVVEEPHRRTMNSEDEKLVHGLEIPKSKRHSARHEAAA